jgi:hypothetical protein
MGVSERFSTFLSNISLTEQQKTAGAGARESVVQALNGSYWGSSSKTDNSKYIGSWGKRTRIRPPRDVDVLFTLPYAVYERFQKRVGNRQSALLQEVKEQLAKKFTNTSIRGDGPAVVIPFTAYNVELVPAFALDNGRYWICMTDNGGRYKTADYDAEASQMSAHNSKTKDNTRELVKMMKRWQAYCTVPIKSFWLELLAISFLDQWQYAGNSKTYYDWMCRDFLKYLCGKTSSFVYAPGTLEAMSIGSAWDSKATSARDRAIKACELESKDAASASDEWQKIFGTDIPKYT